jgi:DNA-3-methyladenine glycosylase II
MKIPDYWPQAVRELAAADPVLGKLTHKFRGLTLRSRGNAFQTLSRAIVGQQISVKAAQAVWNRLAEAVPELSPPAIAAAGPERLRACGLSTGKASYLCDLAGHFTSGRLQPRRWHALDDEALIEELTDVKGIGRWTAEMFLIFYMARPDVLPLDDIGLQRAVGLHYNNGKPVSKLKIERIARPWTPWRSVATWYLWRSLDPIPVEY